MNVDWAIDHDIWKVAKILSKDQEFELRLASEGYPQAKATLMQLPGVGAKVADCVLLFGCGRLEAFPVDTWITKVMARRYNLGGWDTAKVAQFGQVHFGSAAGLAQQFLLLASGPQLGLSANSFAYFSSSRSSISYPSGASINAKVVPDPLFVGPSENSTPCDLICSPNSSMLSTSKAR